MPLRIWKFKLDLHGKTEIYAPLNAETLHLGAFGEDVFVWMLVDVEEEGFETKTESRVFQTIFTGESFEDVPGEYVGTAFAAGGALVVHVFERPSPWVATSWSSFQEDALERLSGARPELPDADAVLILVSSSRRNELAEMEEALRMESRTVYADVLREIIADWDRLAHVSL